MGARVIVSEVDAVRALEAVMDGFEVLPMAEAAPLGDMFVTATGMRGVIRTEHFLAMKDGAILANSGHFDVEVDVAGLRELAGRRRPRSGRIWPSSGCRDGRSLYLLAQGRLVGQVAAEASPASVMDLSFAGLALSARYLLEHAREPTVRASTGRADRDRRADRGAQAPGARRPRLDVLDARQHDYARSWRMGTLDVVRRIGESDGADAPAALPLPLVGRGLVGRLDARARTLTPVRRTIAIMNAHRWRCQQESMTI